MGRGATAKAWLWGAVLLALFFILCVAGKYVSVFSTYILNDQEKWGQFGDYFGGVLNPILSFFAFITLLVTLRTQLVANEESDRRHEEQLREQRLFQLIGLMSQTAVNTKIVVVGGFGDLLGHQAQHYAFGKLSESLAARASWEMIPAPPHMETFEALEKKYKAWRRNYWPAVGFYIDSVFLILEFIQKEESSAKFKEFALEALRVQLSESERLLLWYSAMFTARRVVYLYPLLRSGFVDDQEGSLDDLIKPFRKEMLACSLLWSNTQLDKQLSDEPHKK